ncbi:unnamed protein product [Phytophthora fragariaefolia]|uniref:Unnamed protein product n=1 Tax=Phytophthora fragariaefolia TaxID=1490495 RepID=A0A9W7CXU4_9STRA|nr:unnamed protein product [Phytophthora fragariaefolia]
MYEVSILKEPKKFAECVKVVRNFLIHHHETISTESSSLLQALARIRDFCHGPNWKYSGKVRSLLLGMLSEDPVERFTINQVLEHPWLVVEGLLLPRSASASHSESRKSSPVKTKAPHGPPLSAAARIPNDSVSDASVHPLPVSSTDPTPGVSSAPGTPRSHHHSAGSQAKLSLPSLSPEKPSSRCSPERKGSPDKLAFGVTRGVTTKGDI